MLTFSLPLLEATLWNPRRAEHPRGQDETQTVLPGIAPVNLQPMSCAALLDPNPAPVLDPQRVVEEVSNVEFWMSAKVGRMGEELFGNRILEECIDNLRSVAAAVPLRRACVDSTRESGHDLAIVSLALVYENRSRVVPCPGIVQ